MSDDADEVIVPARMINEVVFCPRLFWLEHVAGAFDDNAHTVLGQHSHRRVDKPGGPVIESAVDVDADGGAVDVVERGTWLSSAALGVSAKLDRVVVDAERPGCVMPIDTKKGRGPREGGLWPADEAQLVWQALLLREVGHRVERVATFHEAERRRAVMNLDDGAVGRAYAALAEARRVRALPQAPPPLVDSPKCPGCSLVHICQPDEVNAVVEGDAFSEAEPLRRVVPPDNDRRSLVVTSSRARVGVDGGEVVVVDRVVDDDGDETEIEARTGFAKVASLHIVGRAQVSTPLLQACGRAGVPVSFATSSGFYVGTFVGGHNNRIDVRIAQHKAAGTDTALAAARVLIADKIAGGRTLLRRNRGDDDVDIDDALLLRLQRLTEAATSAPDAARLLAIEGEAAKKHWGAFSTLLQVSHAAFAMQGRTRRPPRDPTNAMLSYLSGMLVRDCVNACGLAGLDPFLGVYHTTHHGRPSLALDLMEPFRPLLVDSVVLGVVRRAEVKPGGFVRTGQAVAMDGDTRRALAQAYERRVQELVTHPRFGYRISYRQTLAVQARLLARALSGEIPTMPSFRTR